MQYQCATQKRKEKKEKKFQLKNKYVMNLRRTKEIDLDYNLYLHIIPHPLQLNSLVLRLCSMSVYDALTEERRSEERASVSD